MAGLGSRIGTVLNDPFTNCPATRYTRRMLLLALVAATAAVNAPSVPDRPVVRQATATVRIVSGARITQGETPQDAIVRDTIINGADGAPETVRLVEFP